MLTSIVFIFFLLIVVYGIILKKWMAGIYIVAIYALSSFCSILLLKTNLGFKVPTVIPTVLYCALLFLALKPFIRKKPMIEGFSSIKEKNRFVFVGYALSFVTILGMIIILPRITASMDFGLVDSRTAMYQGEHVYTSNVGILMKIGSLFVGYFGGIWYLYIIMFFYALVFVKGKFLLKIMLMTASLSQVELGLTVGGRTNAMYWLLSFLFTLILFYSYLNRRTQKIATLASVACLFVVSSYVAFVTIQRSLFREGGTQGFLLEYVGMSYLYFCEFFDKIDWHPYTLERLFPFASYIMGTGFDLNDYRGLIEQHSGLDIGIFYTFMGDIYVDLGLIGLLVFMVLYYSASSIILRPKTFGLKELIYLSIIYVVPLHGVFYYSLWKTGDFNILFTLLIAKYVCTKISSRRNSKSSIIFSNEKI